MKLRLIGIAVVVGVVALSPVGWAASKGRSDQNWNSGYDIYCGGPCVSAYREANGVVLNFVDPSDGRTTFQRKVSLPRGASIQPIGVSHSVTESGRSLQDFEAKAAASSGSIPPAPAGGNGAVVVETAIYDGRGHVIGTVIIYYIFENGKLVDVQTRTILITNHNHLEE